MSSGQTPLNMELWFRVQQEYYLRQREDHLQQVEGLPSFVPRGSWKSVFTSEELRSRGLMSFISLTDESDDYTWKRVSGELNGRGKMVILWIILCHGSLTMLDCFKTLEICDSQLPIDSHLARAVFADTVSGDVFYEFQFAFSARVLREGYFAEVKEPSRAEKRSLMPYMEEYPLGRGAYGVVAAVRIYSGHIQYEGPGRPQSTESTILARKKLIGNEAGEHYSTELHFINWLQQIREKPHRNIMTPFCGYGHFVNNVMTWNVFYERAQCSLNDYLAHDSHFPMTSKSRLEHIRQMVHVAEALQWLAAKTESWRDGFVESSYYHCDLNPNNILVCVRNDSPNGLIFKIGDFGRALRHSRPLEPGRTHNRDGSSAVRVHSFESMCSAPEMSGSDPFVDQKTDVWSFGCVLLLVLVFNTYGVAAVAEFIASLARRSDDDSFWLVEEGRWKSPTLKTEVLNCMQQLRDLTQDNTDGAVVDGLLTMLKKEVFQTKPKSRAKIDELLKQMQRIYASKDQVMPKEEARTAESDYLLCAQSPQGEFELFHGRRNGHTLFIWRFGWVGPLHKLRPMSPPTTDTVTTPRTISYSDSCGNDKICQVISNRDLFEVLLYSIPTPPHTRVIRDFITLFGFDYASSIALSPDGNFLAIDTTTNNTRRLRLFDVRELLEQMPRTRSLPPVVPPELSPTGLSAPFYDKFKSKPALTRTYAQESRVLRFRGTDRLRLYHGVRHETGDGRVFDVSLWDVSNYELLKVFRLRDNDHELENFVTGFAPFNSRPGFAVILHHRTINLYTPESSETVPVSWSHKSAILTTPDDSWAVVIWGGNRLNVSGFPLPYRPGAEKTLNIQDARKYTFKSATDKACITVGERNEQFLLITYRNGRSAMFNLEPFFFRDESGSN